ncbi:Predicted component of the ribosome quality control (RQC) complex, YloA/Tae2 family, contains fibronectin-binding (FbpA) and DUF814 domains [Anaerobranca californiensis DSM 14826]|uniref:Rqc2 homolog RqcH n=1 Tax=Anaerobranca californiensis DSM 14826 TaxID=1120989 RepID=A0A1M6KRN4_9FIRM|nr:NFACT family protein [Anaerobranca californiensis]SHJ61623.1 Predicted component of the ribosome quality control (RQC) complex, YloA/Tae2 family, contains fibronectin-binding (FbpA) and DUF814 domains [Anaerobranca californiensis DSM 14826]
MFDLLFLDKYTKDIREYLVNARVDKIYQRENLELTLVLRKPGETLNLRIDCNAENHHFRITNKILENPNTPPSFCMLLRKYLSGSKIKDIEMVKGERIINIIFQGRHPEGYVACWVLSIELMGKHSNIIFYDQEEKIVLGVLKATSSETRELKVGHLYQQPPKQVKIPRENLNYKNLLLHSLGDEKLPIDKIMVKYFPLASPILVKEFIYKYQIPNLFLKELEEQQVEELIELYYNFIDNLNYEPIMYYQKDEPWDFYCTTLESLTKKYQIKRYPDYITLVRDFYDYKEDKLKLEKNKTLLIKTITKHQKKLNKKLGLLINELNQYQNFHKYKEIGDLLMANLHQIKKGMAEITLFNYYTSEEERIKLDPSLSPIANCQNYYKKHSKGKRGLEIVKENIENVQGEIAYLDSLLHFISEADNSNTLQEIEQELIKENYLKPKIKPIKKDRNLTQSLPLEFTSKDGFKILVGKNNKQNDLLTLKIAKKGDLWLHTKDLPGSHVIVKNGTKAPETTIIEAANLAAYFSKAKHSSKVAVDYTDVKNVFKPKGAKPGMVNYVDFKTIYITPSFNNNLMS